MPPLRDTPRAEAGIRVAQLVRRAGYAGLAIFTLAFALGCVVLLFDVDFRWEDSYQRAIRNFASGHRAIDLRFPGAEHQPIRPPQGLSADFDLSSSELSFVEQELDGELAKDPSNSRWILLRAQVHLLYLQPAPAIDLLERLRPFSPKDPDILGLLGYAHYLRGRANRNTAELLRAIDFFEQALSIDPSNQDLLFNAGIAQQRVGNRKQATARFESFLSQSPEGAWAREARNRIRELSR